MRYLVPGTVANTNKFTCTYSIPYET